MKFIKTTHHFLLALALLCGSMAYAQQDLTLYNMRYLQQASQVNPAFFPECKVNVGLPGLSSFHARFGNSGFVYADLVEMNAQDSLILTQDKALAELKDLNYLEQAFRYDPIQFGFRVKEKNYFSLNVSARQQFRLTYPKDLFTFLIKGNGGPELLGERADFDGFGTDLILYTEIGLQYARKLLEDDKLTIGIRPKLLLGAANIQTVQSSFGLSTDETDFTLRLDGSFELNQNLPDTSEEIGPEDFTSFDNMGFGVDLGATYQFNEKIQFSASVMDLGFINWKSNPKNYLLEDVDFEFSGFEGFEDVIISDGADSAGSAFETVLDSIVEVFTPQETSNEYRTGLQTRFNIGGNYQLAERSNVGLLLNGAFYKSKLRAAVTVSYNYRIRKWLGLSVNYSAYNRSFLNVGVGWSVNLWPFQWYCMFDNVMAPITPINTRNIHARTGFNLTFGCKDSDKDDDGIPDKEDDCPKEPGPAEYNGCPDSDGDGILDKNDDCPTEKGTAEFNGCPDRDGDGIMDKVDDCPDAPGISAFNGCPDSDEDGLKDSEDECPTVAGLAEFNGCPDTDGDGIKDTDDDCPQVAGLEKFNGCPDTDSDGLKDSDDACPELAGPIDKQGCPDSDGDGLTDNVDQCPQEAGPSENKGCPYGDRDGDTVLDKDDKCPDTPGVVENEGCPIADLDGDGVIDKEDKCIDTPGPVENDGCPYADLDNDGVLDKDDRCPKTPGPVENDGCPVIEEEEQEVINTAFDNLEFESGKDVIKARSFESLNGLAELLGRKEDWKIQIAGHTDSQGSAAFNMKLSEDRSKSVAKYLESKGVPKDQMIVEWYGETKPIADNSTEAGRQQNRRVEMNIVFE